MGREKSLWARLKWSLLSLAALLSVFWLYSLTVARWIEPPLRDVVGPGGPSGGSEQQFNFYRYLPQDAWERSPRARALETDRGAIVFLDYETLSDGSLQLTPLTLVFFTGDSADADSEPPIFVQAPDGAILESDRAINLARAEFGEPVGGRLLGEVTIHRPAGPERDDALWVVSRNVRIDRSKIWSPNSVEFRYGPHWGQGADLEISLDRRENAAVPVRSIELQHLERLVVQTERGFMPATADRDSELESQARTADRATAVPLEIRCQGGVSLDVAVRRVSLREGVQLMRASDGFLDRLLCDRLDLYCRDPDISDESAGLPIDRLVAQGSPVELVVPSQQLLARAARITCFQGERRVILEDPSTAQLRHGTAEIDALRLDYRLHPQHSRRLGQLVAVGPGRFAQPLQDDGRQRLEARWDGPLRLEPGPQPGLHALRVTQGGSVEVDQAGRIQAGEFHLFLTEQPRDGGPLDDQEVVDVLPQQLVAQGGLVVQSPQIQAEAEELRVWFVAADAPLPPPDSGRVAPADAQGFPPAGAGEGQDPRRLLVRGHQLQAQVVLSDSGNYLDDVTLIGQVDVRADTPDQPQLFVRGESLQLSAVTSPQARVRVQGAPAVMGAGEVELRGREIQLARHTSELWIEGAGGLRAPSRPGTEDWPTQAGEVAHVQWQEGLYFDGQQATARGSVRVHGERLVNPREMLHFTASAPALSLRLDQPLELNRTAESQTEIAVGQLQFLGPTEIHNITRDRFGVQQSVDHLQTTDLLLRPQDGQLLGGAGWMRSVRYQSSLGDSVGRTRGEAGEGLLFVEVRFSDRLEGNMHQREVGCYGDVRTLVGPIQHWQQILDPDQPGGLGPDGIELRSRTLQLSQRSATTEEAPFVELLATGSIQVLGAQFTAQGDRLSYDQSKDLLILAGDGPNRFARVDARFGGANDHAQARALRIYPRQRRISPDGVSRLELNSLGLP